MTDDKQQLEDAHEAGVGIEGHHSYPIKQHGGFSGLSHRPVRLVIVVKPVISPWSLKTEIPWSFSAGYVTL